MFKKILSSVILLLIVIPQSAFAHTGYTYTQAELAKTATAKYADGTVPLGDGKYVTDAPKKGYVYLCHAQKDEMGGGAGTDGPWIGANTWNRLQKAIVSGSVTWKDALLSITSNGKTNKISGNGLPINHTTGIYPIESGTAAYAYDRNPNSIKMQNMLLMLPLNPVLQKTPSCMGGEVGIMLSGVPLFSAFDATLRDAPAHEVQDSCDGHPQVSGQYHYHSLSRCFKDAGVQKVLGYALDGFPITGNTVSGNKKIVTNDLDECHGMTSQIVLDGKKKTMYHYVMTDDFPYSVSCFRGKPVSMQVMKQAIGGQANAGTGMMPHQLACSTKKEGDSCSFGRKADEPIVGTCGVSPEGLVCKGS